jgi:uncharacterized iron-regulated membrane protein
MASRQALRRLWWQVHKWIALVLMVALIPLGLSGAVLAWDDAVDHALNPGRYAVTGPVALAPEAYAAAAAGALGPSRRITMMRLPREADPVTVIAERVGKGRVSDRPQRDTVFLDPATGRVLDMQRGNGGFVRVAHMIHGNFFIPGRGVGRTFVGVLGIAMFLLAATGIWIWWPQVGSFSKGLRWRRGDRKLDTNLHHMIGFWISVPLAFQAFTGVWIAWPQMMQLAGLGSGGPRGGGGGMSRPMAADSVHLTLDQAIAAALAGSGPGKDKARVTAISWPTSKEGWRISIGKGGDMQVDDATGAATPAAKREQGGLAMTIRHLHDGSAIGWGWRLLMLTWGIAPTALGITGLLMWLRGRRWRAQAAARKTKVREPVAAA